jgi:putative ABC transport system permease protein
MLKNYIKIALRNYLKNRIYILVNVAGLTLGIACSIVAFFNWDFHVNFDKQNIKSPYLFKINTVRNIGGVKENYALSPMPLGSHILGSIAGVQDFARYTIVNANFKKEDVVLSQSVAFADSQFMELFDFPLISGDVKELRLSNKIIITQEIEKEYFGEDSGLGKELLLVKGSTVYGFLIGAIIENHKLNSSFKFNIIANMEAYENIYNIDREDWSNMTHATFIKLHSSQKKTVIENLLVDFIAPQNESNEEWKADSYYLTPLSTMANEARYIRGNHLGQNNPEGAIMIPNIMAIMILLVACFNFTNTSIAMSGSRIKEIGVRKALGAQRGQLSLQLLTESFIIVLISLILGLLLSEMLLPLYSSLGPWIDIQSNYTDNIGFLLFLMSLVIGTGLLAGAYPALYVSSFNVISIFRNKIKVKDSNWFTKSLLILQISFSLMAIIQGVVYVQNSWLQGNFNLGFNRKSIITVPISENSNITVLKNELLQEEGFKSLAFTNHHIGYSISSAKFKTAYIEDEVRLFEVGPNYLNTMEIELLEGRNFYSENQADQISSIIVNETLLKQFNINALGSKYKLNNKEYQIIGVIKDFYPFGLWKGNVNNPTVLKLSSDSTYNFLAVNFGENDIALMNKKVLKIWSSVNPDLPYEGEVVNQQVYLSELLSNNMSYFSFFQALVATLLSITGLYTMVSLNILNRTKEIGIRKIFGASRANIIKLFNTNILIVLAIAIFMGTASGYYITEIFLDLMFSIHAHLNFATIAISVISLLILSYGVIGFKILDTMNNNPVDSLRQE